MVQNINLSYGSEILLGFKKGKIAAPLTTIYANIGDKCIFNCSFCARAKHANSGKGYISRILWEGNPTEEILKRVKSSDAKRFCLQVVNYSDVINDIVDFINMYNEMEINIPLSISYRPLVKKEIDILFETKKDLTLGIALDAANPTLYSLIRKGDMETQISYIEHAKKHYDNVTTHIIVGLGESDKDIYSILKRMYSMGVNVGLFAFTPIRGTKMENNKPPEISRYRKVQILHYIVKNNLDVNPVFDENDNILNFDKPVNSIIDSGEAFRTTGCPNCNRPYYNEKPSGVIYNYPYKLNESRSIYSEIELK
jgi:biotin synthase-related radical SAM superfamily protein